MEQFFELINPVLAGLILAGAEGLRRVVPSLSGQVASIIVAVVFIGVWFLFDDGMTIIEGIISFLTAVAAYDFAVKPIKVASRDKDPIHSGGGGGVKTKP